MKSIWVYGKLVVPGGCPICGGLLSAKYVCQRSSCGRAWNSLQSIQEVYEFADKISAMMQAHKAISQAKETT